MNRCLFNSVFLQTTTKIILGGWLCVMSLMVGAQAPQGRCWVHMDKPFYVSGEIIWYKVYFPRHFDAAPLMVRSALVNDQGGVVEEYYLQSGNNPYVSGYYKLPYELPSGDYSLILTGTHRQRHVPIRLAQVSIPVISDLASEDNAKKPKFPQENQRTSQAGPVKVEINLDRAQYQARRPVTARIQVTNAAGEPVLAQLSVSVFDRELLGEGGKGITLVEGVALPNAQLDSSIRIGGKVMSSGGQGLYTPLLGVFSPSENDLIYAQTDGEGNFSIPVPDFWGRKNVQFADFANPDIRVRIPSFYSVSPSSGSSDHSTAHSYPQYSRDRKKIYQLTARVEMPLTEIPVERTTRAFEPDRRIRMEDYASFPDLPTFFQDVSTPLKFRTDRAGKYFAKMFNPDPLVRSFYDDPPLFFVDGRIVDQVDSIARMDVESVVHMDLFYYQRHATEQFGPLGMNGVVMITTNTSPVLVPPTEADNVFSLSGIQTPATFPYLTETQLSQSPHQPFFRPQVYWNPTVYTDAQGRAEIRFFQPDDISTFRVEIVAQDATGAVGMGTVRYEVVWERN